MERTLHQDDALTVVELEGSTEFEHQLRFTDTRGAPCCWKGGTREFAVILAPRRSVVYYRADSDIPPEGHYWGSSHEDCLAEGIWNFTKRCLEWLRDHFLPPGKPCVIRGLVHPQTPQLCGDRAMAGENWAAKVSAGWEMRRYYSARELGFEPENTPAKDTLSCPECAGALQAHEINEEVLGAEDGVHFIRRTVTACPTCGWSED